MKTNIVVSICIVLGLACIGCDTSPSATPVSEEASDASVHGTAKAVVETGVELFPFLPAGDVGGGVLTAGTFFPPTMGSHSKLVRHADWVQYNIHTTGLPPGAYTVWIVTINAPQHCTSRPCTTADVFLVPAADATVFWSDGGIVQSNGVGNFKARVHVGDVPSDAAQIGWPGNGLTDPFGAEIHLIVKYHGPAADDPALLYEQTHTLLGGCFENANALDLGEPFPGVVFGVQCFDPQAVVHMP